MDYMLSNTVIFLNNWCDTWVASL